MKVKQLAHRLAWPFLTDELWGLLSVLILGAGTVCMSGKTPAGLSPPGFGFGFFIVVLFFAFHSVHTMEGLEAFWLARFARSISAVLFFNLNS